MGIIIVSRRGNMKVLMNYHILIIIYIYIIIILSSYDTIDRSEYGSEKERWIRELWMDIINRSRLGEMNVL